MASDYIRMVERQARKKLEKLNSQQQKAIFQAYRDAGKQLVKGYKTAKGPATRALYASYIKKIAEETEQIIQEYSLKGAAVCPEMEKLIMLKAFQTAGRRAVFFCAVFRACGKNSVAGGILPSQLGKNLTSLNAQIIIQYFRVSSCLATYFKFGKRKGRILMLYSLENEELLVQVRDHGAELRSIKERADETEYLWRGDPAWWKYSAPLPFPIVGQLVDGKYRVGGKTYELPAHGLARISDFELVEQKKDAIRFLLGWTEETLQKYPWKFRLDVG